MRSISAIPVLLTVLIAIWAVYPRSSDWGAMTVVSTPLLRHLDGIIFGLLVWVIYLTWSAWA